MDELEISGKRYISTRRAAKEHKYHSDYIGQLIRGGKVEGQKVGRSWYVAADSLTEYLGKETPPKSMRVQPTVEQVIKREDVEESAQEVVEEIPEEPIVEEVETKEAPKKVQPKIVESMVAEVEEIAANHIPVKISGEATVKKEVPTIQVTRSTLRYIADEEPLYPSLQSYEKVKTMPRHAEVVEEMFEDVDDEPVVVVEKRTRPKKYYRGWAIRGSAVLAIGLILAGVVAAASMLVVATTTIQGETASVGYAFESFNK